MFNQFSFLLLLPLEHSRKTIKMAGYENDHEKKYGEEYSTEVGPATGAQYAEGNQYPHEDVVPAVGLQRQLKSRHLAMISIGGVM